jgi:sodium transport system permease protein
MKRRLHLVAVILRHELLMLLRDRRTVILSIVLPAAVMPLFMFLNLALEKKREAKLEATTFTYCVTGSQDQLARTFVSQALAFQDGDQESDEQPLKLLEKEVTDPEQALRDEQIYFYLEGMSASEWQQLEEEIRAEQEAEEETVSPARKEQEAPVPVVRVVYRSNWDASQDAARKVATILERVRQKRRHASLVASGFPLAAEAVGAVEKLDVASSSQVAGSKLGKLLTLMVMMFILMGGSVVATDSIAGEKERGTLETLLTTAAGRVEIVTAKQLAILAVALVITLIQALNLLLYIVVGIIPVPESFAFSISAGDAVLIFLLFLPAAATAASVLLLISGRAGSYKEAQLLFFPVFLVTMVICAAPFLPGIELRSAIVMAPVVNISIAVKEVMAGNHDWLMLGLAWFITAAAAAWVVRLTHRSLATERLIAAPERESIGVAPADLFPKQVLRWFAVIWVLMYLAASKIPSLEGQVLFNIVILFGGGSLLMLRRYRLAPKQALALRAPKWPVWVAVSAGAPAGLIAVIGVFRLASIFLPIPEKLLEMGQLPAMERPLWQLIVLVCVAPAIFEEIFFRGMLLHGLRKRLRPVTLCLVVSLVFGLFHIDLYRITPIAYLGIMLATLTLLTGSLLPAMLWHFLHNALSILTVHYVIPLTELDSWLYTAASAVLAAAVWIVYRNRTPYPDLKKRNMKGQMV